MIAIDVKKLRLSMAELERRKARVLKRGVEGYRQKIYYLLGVAAKVSPQFSGDFASNWTIAVNGDMPVYKMWADKASGSMTPMQRDNGQVEYRAHRAGDPAAITTAMARGAAALKKVTSLQDKVHLVNATDLWTDGTKMHGPDGVVNLRAENIIPGGIRIESYVRARAREKTLTKEVP